MKIVFLSSHFNHRRVRDRLKGVKKIPGARTILFAFSRSESEFDSDLYSNENCESISLGIVPAGSIKERITAMLSGMRLMWKRRKEIEGADLVLINNFTVLCMYFMLPIKRSKSVYDVPDIHALQYSETTTGRAIRLIEKWAIKKCTAAVVSSPWFSTEYHKKLLETDLPTYLIENRIETQKSGAKEIPHTDASEPEQLTLLWNGILRCKTSLKLLESSIARDNSRWQVCLAGVTDQILSSPNNLQKNFFYTGPYKDDHLKNITKNVDAIWAIDIDDGHNSRWLLPNRLYQGVAFSLPLIALRGTATAAVVEHFDIGFIVKDATPEAITETLRDITINSLREKKYNLSTIRSKAYREDEWPEVINSIIENKNTHNRMINACQPPEMFCFQ